MGFTVNAAGVESFAGIFRDTTVPRQTVGRYAELIPWTAIMAESSKISLPIGPKHLNARSIEEVDAEMVRGLNTKALSDRGNKAELTAAIAARDPEAKAKAKLAHVQHPQLVDAFTPES